MSHDKGSERGRKKMRRKRKRGGKGINLRWGALEQDISSLATGGRSAPLRNVLWGSQKEPHENSGVWQAVAPAQPAPTVTGARLFC